MLVLLLFIIISLTINTHIITIIIITTTTTGHSATKEEKEKSSTFAQTYITESSIRDGRSTDTAIVTVYAGKEPLFFTCHFLGWDSSGE